MFNRLPAHYLLPPSTGDKLLAGAYGLKIEVLTFPPDDDGEQRETSIEFQLSGSIPEAEAGGTLAALLAHFRTGGGESEAGHV